jgi:hypothetical protein
MKIGILTFHDGINYGAFFQVYALQSYLLNLGYQCQVINYKSLGFTLREYKVFLDPRRVVKRQIWRNIIKIIRFKVAHRKLNLTPRICKEDGLSKFYFDALIIGSDEVWNFKTDLIGIDPVYFSQGLKAGRFISYGASFGNIDISAVIPDQLKIALSRIEYVSVRDENSANIIRPINKNPVKIVLDPTFIVNLLPEAINPPIRGFILIYGFFNKKMIQQIIGYARYVGKKTISIGYNCSWCDINLDTLSPFKWLGYFSVCDIVITTMFHGFIFSILNQKEFCMFITPYRKNKLGNLPNDLELSERIITEDATIQDVFEKKIDYSKVNLRIEIKRKKSENFLVSSLKY